jgi:hypothetical protein
MGGPRSSLQRVRADAAWNLFRSFCRPILNKPKPKAATTEAPKKEEPKKQQQQQSEKEPEANGDAEITELDDEAEAKKPDMDVD